MHENIFWKLTASSMSPKPIRVRHCARKHTVIGRNDRQLFGKANTCYTVSRKPTRQKIRVKVTLKVSVMENIKCFLYCLCNNFAFATYQT